MKKVLMIPMIKVVAIWIIVFSSFTRSLAQVSVVLNINMDQFSLSGTSIWFIDITNSNSTISSCYLHATIIVPNEGTIADGTSKSFSLKPFEKKIVSQTGAELADSNKIDYDKSYKEWYSRNNELPSKKYTVCVQVIETKSGAILAKACQDFEAQKFRPPVNIYPIDRDTITGGNLSFQWLPPQPFNPEFTYSIRIVEVLSIQSSVAALYSNNYFYTEDYLKAPVLQYPIRARPLEEGKTYAWLVEGRKGSLELKSEPTVFVVGMSAIPVQKTADKPRVHYSQYIDLLSASAREIQFVDGGEIPLMFENKGAPYQLVYCITGSKQNILVKGKVPVRNGLNKLLISTGDLKAGKDETYYLKLFSSTAKLPDIRFKELNNSTIK